VDANNEMRSDLNDTGFTLPDPNPTYRERQIVHCRRCMRAFWHRSSCRNPPASGIPEAYPNSVMDRLAQCRAWLEQLVS
jgi:hypothetical protein